MLEIVRRRRCPGDLPRGDATAAGSNAWLTNAARAWSRYVNMGTPIYGPHVAAPEEAAPDFEFEKVKASIRQDVVAQFERVFGDRPSATELQHWTDFVIQAGAKLHRGDEGLSPEAALREATGRLERTP